MEVVKEPMPDESWVYDPAARTVTVRTTDRMTGQRFELRYE
jgi:hypothetical protein